MKKLFLNFLLITVFMAPPLTCCSRGRAEIPTKSFVKITKLIKILKCSEKTKKCTQEELRWTASGLAVQLTRQHNTILTAGHICDSNLKNVPDNIKKIEMEISILDYNNSEHKADIVLYTLHTGTTADLCILESKSLNVPKIAFSRSAPKIGDDVIAMSSPYGVYHPPTVPIFKGVFSGNKDVTTSIVTVPSSPGSSGGPVLNLKYQIVGVIFAVHMHFPNVTLITNHEITKDFLNVAKKILKNNQTK